MSLILEALRKSEAERRRGRAPDLHAELPPVARAPASASPAWWWLAAAVALLLAGVLAGRAWWSPPLPVEGGPPVAETESRPAPPVVSPVLSPDDGAGVPGAVEGAAQAPGPGQPEIETLQAMAHPAGRTVERAPASTTGAPSTGPQVVPAPAPPRPEPAPPVATRIPPAPSPASHPATTPAPERNPLPPTAALQAPDPAAVRPATIGRPEPPAPALAGTQASAADGTAPVPAGPISLADLTPDQRRQLPPLKLSMHLWSADPSRRFVILDGHRLAEGDRTGSAVIERIGSDHVVIAWSGYRIRMPLR